MSSGNANEIAKGIRLAGDCLSVQTVRAEHSDGRIYYSNAVCGLAQWEHPMVSYLTGVALKLVEADGLGELERLPMRRECGPRKGGGDVSGGRGAPLTLTARLESRVGSLGLPDAVA